MAAGGEATAAGASLAAGAREAGARLAGSGSLLMLMVLLTLLSPNEGFRSFGIATKDDH